MTEPSEAFKEWHAKRAAEILKNADALATEYIKDGLSDSIATHRTAIYKVLESVDETGWDAWQSGREQALEEAAQICNGEQWRNSARPVAYIEAFNQGCGDCEAAIRRLK